MVRPCLNPAGKWTGALQRCPAQAGSGLRLRRCSGTVACLNCDGGVGPERYLVSISGVVPKAPEKFSWEANTGPNGSFHVPAAADDPCFWKLIPAFELWDLFWKEWVPFGIVMVHAGSGVLEMVIPGLFFGHEPGHGNCFEPVTLPNLGGEYGSGGNASIVPA
jgi:hypothetical protein